MPAVPAGAIAVWLATFAFALAGGLVPFMSIEGYVLALSAAAPQAHVLPVALAAALGQMTGKSLVYLSGRRLIRVPSRPGNGRLCAVAARLSHSEPGAMALVLTSSLASIPPFYAVCLAAGALRLRFGRFFVVGCAGGFLRFAMLFAVPRLLG